MNKIEKTETLSKILANRKFSVDVFQREYRWGQKQIEAIDAFIDGKIKSTYIVIDPLFGECEPSRLMTSVPSI